ncbi:MAG: hypothetical protein P8M05_01430 [Flavobacteriales bacterium]|nr:hypothetical protein [Flavobacteriales bacterium]
MKPLTCILAITLAIANPLFGQNPGYIGHKFQAQIDFSSMPNANGTLIPGYSENYPNYTSNFSLNSGIGTTIGYTVSRKMNFILSYNYKKRNTYFPHGSHRHNPSYYDAEYYFIEGDGSVDIVNQRFAIGLQKFKGDGIAPVGKYFEFGFAMNMARLHGNTKLNKGRASYIPGVYPDYIDTSIVDAVSVVTDLKNVRLSCFYLGFGKTIVDNNRIYVDMRFRIHIPLSFKYYRNNSLNGEFYTMVNGQPNTNPTHLRYDRSNTYGESNYAQSYINDRLRKYQFLNELYHFKIGLGYVF